ncbi:unnamed protein product, partial [Closterium sp. NIES-54]
FWRSSTASSRGRSSRWRSSRRRRRRWRRRRSGTSRRTRTSGRRRIWARSGRTRPPMPRCRSTTRSSGSPRSTPPMMTPTLTTAGA